MNDKYSTVDRTKPTPFNGWNKINRYSRDFNDSAKIRRKGKDISLQDFTNENNQDCTIYDVYNKYRGDMKLTTATLNTMSKTVSDELAEIKDLKSAFDVMKLAEKSWRELPLEVRKEFNHDVKKFQQNGLDWAQKKYNETLAQIRNEGFIGKQPNNKVEVKE